MSKSLDKSVNEALVKYFDNDINKVNIKLLKQYVTEKKITKKIAAVLYHLVSKTIIDLISKLKNKNVQEILDKSAELTRFVDRGNGIMENRSYRGFVYERLWDLCIKFGIVDGLIMKSGTNEDKSITYNNTCHIFGNSNIEGIQFKKDCWKGHLNNYLRDNVQSGNSGGYSDITFINQREVDGKKIEDLYFVSVKYYEKGKDVGKYDIGKLCTLAEKHHKENRNIHIILFVKNKQDVIKVFNKQHQSSDIMMKYIDPQGDKTYPNIYDQFDHNGLEYNIYKLKLLLEQYNYLQDDESIHIFETEYLKLLKSPFIPRFHQKLFIDKILDLEEKGNKNILVGAIPRSGKSYIMMGTMLDYVRKYGHSGKFLNFILITPAPNETFGEYQSIIDEHIDFHSLNMNYVQLKSIPGRQKLNIGKPDKHNIFVVSKQMLGYKEQKDSAGPNVNQDLKQIKEQTEKRINQILKGQKFDMIFLDEAHFGMSTDRAQEILHIIDGLGKSTPKVYVTATYNKPLNVYGIDNDECKLTWDINDIQMIKDKQFNFDDNPIKKRFGANIYKKALDFFGNDTERIKQSYMMYPKPYLMTSMWDYQYLEQEKDKIDIDSYGFDMEKLFTVKNGSFENRDQMIQMMRYYFGYPDKTKPYGQQHIYRQRGILPRIRKICSGQCRTMQDPNHFTSQLWFLPYGPHRPIDGIIIALLNLFKTTEFKDIKENYHFYVAVDLKDISNIERNNVTLMKDSHNIKKEIQEIENDGKNIIILAGARLQLGISLRNVDIVTLWNSVTSSDAIFQMLFRSMTEVNVPPCDESTIYCNEKKFGFMVDLNPQRALTNTLLFGENLSSKKLQGKSKYEAIADCINIDEDVFHDKYEKGEQKKFIETMFNKLYSSWDKNVDDMKKLTQKVVKYDDTILKQVEKALRSVKLSKKQQKTNVQEADEGFEPGGKQQKKDEPEPEPELEPIKNKKEKKKAPLSELASEVLAELISLLNIFSLYTDSDKIRCLLTDTISKEQVEEGNIRIVDNIEELIEKIFKSENKDIFLQILNRRLGGSEDEMYPEVVIEMIIKSIREKKGESENNMLSINKLVMTQKKKYYTIKEPDKLLEYINDNLTPKEKERKEAGEVFTPISIVKEMLDKLPNDVWHKPDYKWLDPAVGIGNFPIIAYLKLMEGLKSWEPNEEKRRKHILEKMLYMVEISKKSIFILNKIFCGDKYKLNIYPKSFLEDEYTLNSFDVIMANPPYNEGGVGKGGGVFWKGFVEKSLKILNDNGYMVMIHPTGWRKPKGERASGGDIWDSFRPYHLEALKISDIKIPNFPRVDYYILNKSNKTSNTHVINEFQSIKTDTKTKLKDLPFIPHLINDDVVSILGKLFSKKGDKFNIHYNQSFKPNKDDKTKKTGKPHAFFYDVSKNDYVKVFKTYTDKDKNTEYISKSKIIMTYKSGKKPALLYPQYFTKEMGGTNNTMYQLIDKSDNVGNLMKLLDSKLIHFLLKITQYSEAPNYINEFKILNMITKPNSGKLKSDKDIYKYYGLTKQEIELVEKVVSGGPMKKDKKKTPKQVKSLSDYGLKELFKSNSDTGDELISDPLPKPTKPKKPNSPKKQAKKTMKKSKCSELHPDPPCLKDKPRLKNGCCYKDKKTKKGGGKRRRHKRSKRKRR